MISISKKKLADSVIEQIRSMIERGDLKEGDKLPNQNEFAAQLGVSRTVLREALHTLTIRGVIEQRPKSGTIIKASTPFLYADHLNTPLIEDTDATVELIEARRYIEVGAVELAVRNATEDQIREMGALVDDMTALLATRNESAYTEKNITFHLLIAEASHNRILVHLLATIRDLMEQWMQESISVLPGLLERSLKSHEAIYKAIRDRDRKKAVASMKSHLYDFQKSIEKYYRTATGKGLRSKQAVNK